MPNLFEKNSYFNPRELFKKLANFFSASASQNSNVEATANPNLISGDEARAIRVLPKDNYATIEQNMTGETFGSIVNYTITIEKISYKILWNSENKTLIIPDKINIKLKLIVETGTQGYLKLDDKFIGRNKKDGYTTYNLADDIKNGLQNDSGRMVVLYNSDNLETPTPINRFFINVFLKTKTN